MKYLRTKQKCQKQSKTNSKLNSHFNKNWSERKNSTEKRNHNWFHEPFFLRNWTWNCIDSTWMIRLAIQVPSNDGSNKCQRKNDKDANASNGQHCSEWNRTWCVIIDCNEVNAESSSTYKDWDQESWEKHLTNPNFASHSSIQWSTKISIDWWSCSINKYGSWQEWSTSEIVLKEC